MAVSPETANPLNALADADYEFGPRKSTLGAGAAYRLNGNEQLVDSVKANFWH